MYNERLENLIDAALADGELTEKEKQVLFKNAQAMGVDLDEFEMVLDAKLYEKKKTMQKEQEEKITVQPAAPKSNKMGDVKKCPNCGAIVSAYQAKCTECGYEFSDVEANSSSQELSTKLEKIVSDCNNKSYNLSFMEKLSGTKSEESVRNTDINQQQASCIRNFPIPQTKADLFEFSMTMKAGENIEINGFQEHDSGLKTSQKNLKNAYRAKYDECINKIKVLFPNDPLFAPLFEKKKSFIGKMFGK